jgi:pimeloyl-ACP methyl ester carboxylesterase
MTTSSDVQRDDYWIKTADGVSLRVRHVAPVGATDLPVIVMVHGIAAPLEPTYDLALPGYSILEELARRNIRALAFDHRNFGKSDRDLALDRPAIEDPQHRGVHTLDDSVEDIRAVIADARQRFGVRDLTLFGSSRGAVQVLAYAVQHGDGVSLVIMNNPSSTCYLAGSKSGEEADWLREERTDALRAKNYLSYTAEFQRKRWSKLFGEGSKVDTTVQDAYIDACLRTDEVGSRQDPPVFRVPTESIPDRVPLVPLDGLRIPCLAIDAEHRPPEHRAAFLRAMPPGLARIIDIRDSDHFTLRNPKRFELVNIIEAAIVGLSWGRQRAGS